MGGRGQEAGRHKNRGCPSVGLSTLKPSRAMYIRVPAYQPTCTSSGKMYTREYTREHGLSTHLHFQREEAVGSDGEHGGVQALVPVLLRGGDVVLHLAVGGGRGGGGPTPGEGRTSRQVGKHLPETGRCRYASKWDGSKTREQGLPLEMSPTSVGPTVGNHTPTRQHDT